MDKIKLIFKAIVWLLKQPITISKMLYHKFYRSLSDDGKDIYHKIEYVVVQKIGAIILLGFIAFFAGVIMNDLKFIDLETSFAAWQKEGYVKWAVGILLGVMLYDGYRMYTRLRKSQHAWETRDYVNQEIILKREILFYKRKADYEKTKIDIMKSFSPVPIILLFVKDILGYFTDLDIASMDKVTMAVLVGIVLYGLFFISFWDNYKVYTRNLNEFENELLALDIDNLYEKKSDRVKESDFKDHLLNRARINQNRSVFQDSDSEIEFDNEEGVL